MKRKRKMMRMLMRILKKKICKEAMITRGKVCERG
jgi:hypothetical protein